MYNQVEKKAHIWHQVHAVALLDTLETVLDWDGLDPDSSSDLASTVQGIERHPRREEICAKLMAKFPDVKEEDLKPVTMADQFKAGAGWLKGKLGIDS